MNCGYGFCVRSGWDRDGYMVIAWYWDGWMAMNIITHAWNVNCKEAGNLVVFVHLLGLDGRTGVLQLILCQFGTGVASLLFAFR